MINFASASPLLALTQIWGCRKFRSEETFAPAAIQSPKSSVSPSIHRAVLMSPFAMSILANSRRRHNKPSRHPKLRSRKRDMKEEETSQSSPEKKTHLSIAREEMPTRHSQRAQRAQRSASPCQTCLPGSHYLTTVGELHS